MNFGIGGILGFLLFGLLFRFDPVFFRRPVPQIGQSAAIGAKRSKWIVRPFCGFMTNRARKVHKNNYTGTDATLQCPVFWT
jgi:hypothetical protein